MHRPSRATPDFEVPADFTLDPYSKLGVSPVTEESFLVRHPVRDPDRVKTDMVEVLGNAVLASKRVSFEYTSTKGSSSSRTVEPGRDRRSATHASFISPMGLRTWSP